MSVRRSINPRKPSGFTLIELLVVVGILVALAGALLPKLDRIDQKTNKGIAANNMTGSSRYIQTYRILHNAYPDNWDSLLVVGGSALAQAPTEQGPGLEPQTTGGTADGALASGPHKLIAGTLDNSFLRSLNRMGIETVLDWDATKSNLAGGGGSPADLFNTPRKLSAASGSVPVAMLNVTTPGSGSTAAVGDSDAIDIINKCYPQNLVNGTSGAVPAGKALVVLGFGPLNQAVGDVVQDCPAYSNTDPSKYYTRFLAVFEARDDGSRAELKIVVGADGDLTRDEMNDFYDTK